MTEDNTVYSHRLHKLVIMKLAGTRHLFVYVLYRTRYVDNTLLKQLKKNLFHFTMHPPDLKYKAATLRWRHNGADKHLLALGLKREPHCFTIYLTIKIAIGNKKSNPLGETITHLLVLICLNRG